VIGDNPADLRSREVILTRLINNLHTISELHRALALEDWLDKEQDISVRPEARVDQKIRDEVGKRYIDAVGASLKSTTPLRQIAAADLLSDLGTNLRGIGAQQADAREGLNRVFGPDLAQLLKGGDPRVEAAAARALGNINPEAKVAVPALAQLLKSSNVVLRRAAAASLRNLVKNLTQLVSGKGKGPTPRAASRDELVHTAVAVAPVAASGLENSDTDVRRLSAEALLECAAALSEMVQEPEKNLRPFTDGRQPTPDELAEIQALRRALARERAQLAPLAKALGNQAPKLVQAMRDPDAQTRLMARKALEEMGNAFQRQERREASVPNLGETGKTGQGRGEEQSSLNQAEQPAFPNAPLIKTLDESMRTLVRGLRDPDLAIRLTTIDALEMFGDAARPVAPELAAALCDPNAFVRWAAARTLGKIAPVAPELVVPRLANLLNDPDLDLRMVAANSLGAYGPTATAAVPALTRTVGTGDGEVRRTAMLALASIGPENARAAIPAITEELTHHNPRVRQMAAQVLGRFGPLARSAEPALLQRAADDSDVEVRKAASDALLNILPAVRER
jgi:HEAT repeat protein